MQQKILVTGGLGFIGSHTVVELISKGFEVVIVDDLSNSQPFILENIQKISGVKPGFYKINMLDKEELIRVFAVEKNIAAVIHFAAFKAVGESAVQPLKYFKNNLFSLITLLECMEAYNVASIVFSSSATVYGEPDILPVTESAPFKSALSAYGSTKQAGEDILKKVASAGGINCIALRYFNPVGAHETSLLGELPSGTPNNLMPIVTQTAAGKIDKLKIYGNDYGTPDGTCVRDYIHVTDLAIAHVKSCDRLLDNLQESNYEVFNIGTGNGVSVMEIITAFEKYNGVKVDFEITDRRKGDAERIFADVSLAADKLKWKAMMGLKEMVTSSWKWQQQLQ
jgi:UDP-glucose 4-epimerase